ncbi:DegQ family serine endoprotease [Gammaproteobacteria bacterium]|nr:DegQ family serine endoprotease [Gammaproteobacteria bacterium]
MKSTAKSRFQRLALAATVTTALATATFFSLSPNAMATVAPVVAPAGVVGTGVQYGPPSFADLAERVEPAVVSITVTGKTDVAAKMNGRQHQRMPQFPEGSPFGEFFEQFRNRVPGMPGGDKSAQREFKGAGSGFIISPDGYVVTNNHVVENATEIGVILQDGSHYQATIKGRDPKTDLALLKVNADASLPYVELGDSDSARVGEWVVAVGNPFGLGGTVTAGILSARGRDINSGPYDDYLQVDAPINRGNSGGPLFNNRGQVIGVNSAIYSPTGGSVGIGFAIPSNLVKDVVAQLETSGKVTRGWLGVQIQPLTDDIAASLGLTQTHGALVASVHPGSPAALGGVKPGDVLVSMNGEQLIDFKDLPKLVAAAEAGSESTLQVKRQGETLKLTIEIGDMPDDGVKVALADEGGNDDGPKLGVYLAELTPEARQRYRIGKDTEGVLITGVQQGSPAAKAGIEAGQVIHMVGQETVTSPQDVVARVKQAAVEKKPSVLLMVEHKGMQHFVAVKFAST